MWKKAELIQGKSLPAQHPTIVLTDIDGTLTKKDEVDKDLLHQISNSAKAKKISLCFITGRTRIWLENCFIKEIKDFQPTDFRFYPEFGLVAIECASDIPIRFREITGHPLVKGALRKRISRLFLQPSQLEELGSEDIPAPGHYAVRDPNGVRYSCPLSFQDLAVFPDLIWSDTMEVIGSAEVVRDDCGMIPVEGYKITEEVAEILGMIFEYWQVSDIVEAVPTHTAIDIVPIIDGIPFDKSWSASRALQQVSKERKKSIEAVAQEAIAIGDGLSDFRLSHPVDLETGEELAIPFVFVGEEMPSSEGIKGVENTIIKAAPGFQGPEVTEEALRILGLLEGR